MVRTIVENADEINSNEGDSFKEHFVRKNVRWAKWCQATWGVLGLTPKEYYLTLSTSPLKSPQSFCSLAPYYKMLCNSVLKGYTVVQVHLHSILWVNINCSVSSGNAVASVIKEASRCLTFWPLFSPPSSPLSLFITTIIIISLMHTGVSFSQNRATQYPLPLTSLPPTVSYWHIASLTYSALVVTIHQTVVIHKTILCFVYLLFID